MYLYHAFPRPPIKKGPIDTSSKDAMTILSCILAHGLLCTPEKLDIFPDPNTEYKAKRALIESEKPERCHIQSRACFTLCETSELYAQKVRGLSPSHNGPTYEPGMSASHADLFGPFAIAIDPLVARRVGIVPTSYYSPNDIYGRRYESDYESVPGLNIQIISRLNEIREILIVLSHIEGGLTEKGYTFPNHEELDSIGFSLEYDSEVIQNISSMTENEKRELYDLFNLDREPAFNLTGFVEMMLNLFQQTDSSVNDDVLAFFQQREFRLIHHMRRGMVWFSLGRHPTFLNPLAIIMRDEINFLRNVIISKRTNTDEDYFKRCWLLESVDNAHFRDYIDHIVAPEEHMQWIYDELKTHGLEIEVRVAEKFGYENLYRQP